jgi:ABC-type transport system involved in multi-copper enzyme maturation permease subunit
MRIPLAVMAVGAVIFIIPVLVYGLASVIANLQPPGGQPGAFLLGIISEAICFPVSGLIVSSMIPRRWAVL